MALAEAAESLVGCPFRLYGRDPRHGVDCVGLVSCALETVGRSLLVQDYGLRNCTIKRHLSAASLAGLEEVTGRTKAGDIFLFCLSMAQYHLGIISSRNSLVHAHAGLKRVVTTPLPLSWRVERQWRVAQD